MISADFYSTQSSQVSGQIELTDSFNNIQNYFGASAYWLGYINRDNVPQFRKLTDFEKNYDTSTGTLVSASFNPIDTENLDFTYGAWGAVNAGRCFSDPQGQIISMYSSFTPWRYINKCKVGLVRMRTPNFRAMLMVRTSSDGQTWGAPQTITVSSEFEDNDNNDNGFEAFYEFVKGERTLTKTFEFSNISLDIIINANDLNENYYIPVNGESDGVFYDGILFIYRAWFDPTWNLSTPFDDSTASVTNGCIHTVGVTDLFDNDGNVYYTGSDWYQMARNEANGPNFFYLHRDTGGNGDIYPTSFGTQNAGYPITTYDDLHYIGGYDFEIGFNNSVWSNANHIIYTNGNIACINQYDNQLFCYTMIRPVDIRYNATLVARYEAGWLPEYDENNCPTGEFFRDSEVEEKGRPWQIDELTDNEYTEGDRPPYTPPEPGPGPTPQETEPKYPGFPTYGTTVRIVPTMGVNFYALNNSLAQSFIQRLWGQPKNFYEAIQIAGQQVDSIFDYIQSFRFYPINYDFSSENVYPVIFGTGAVLKESDGDTNFQLSSPAHVQYADTAGTWNLSDPIYHWRKNFLDYSPYLKMSMYLPFAGTVELSPEAVASHTDISDAIIRVAFSLDISSGTITYYVVNQADTLLAQKTAKIAIDLPLSGNNAAEQSAAILRAQFSTIKQLLGAGTSAATSTVTTGLAGVASATVSTLSSVGDMYLQNSLAQRAIPVEIQGMGGTISALAGGQYPYITINRQKVSNPPNYAHTTGYLVEGTYKISILNGFTVCRNVDVSGINQATDKERAQIKQILESGFYA